MSDILQTSVLSPQIYGSELSAGDMTQALAYLEQQHGLL